MKIGVGILQKGPDAKYNAFQTFNIVEVGKWKVDNGRDWVQFRQNLAYGKWGYQYTKRITLPDNAGGFVISHTLQNTGSNTFDSLWYCHNFTIIDGEPIGPAYRVLFPFDVKLKDKPVGDVSALGRVIRIGEVTKEKPIWTLIETGKGKAEFDQVTVENSRSGAALRIVGDQPLDQWRFYAAPTAACPEPFVRIHVGPGEKMTWSYTYTFLVSLAEKAKGAAK